MLLTVWKSDFNDGIVSEKILDYECIKLAKNFAVVELDTEKDVQNIYSNLSSKPLSWKKFIEKLIYEYKEVTVAENFCELEAKFSGATKGEIIKRALGLLKRKDMRFEYAYEMIAYGNKDFYMKKTPFGAEIRDFFENEEDDYLSLFIFEIYDDGGWCEGLNFSAYLYVYAGSRKEFYERKKRLTANV